MAAKSHDGRALALAHLRSRKGFELAHAQGLLRDERLVADALALHPHPIAAALLAPASVTASEELVRGIPDVAPFASALLAATLGSSRHLALVEAVRRAYQVKARAKDRADKEAAARC